MSIQTVLSAITQTRGEIPCDQGNPPDVGFAVPKESGGFVNMGLSYEGEGLSAGAVTNTYANLINDCFGHKDAPELGRWLRCSSACGLVGLCEDQYRCDEPRFASGVRLGAARHGNVSAHLTVPLRDLGEPNVACIVQRLQPALDKAADDFPLPRTAMTQSTRLSLESNAASRAHRPKSAWLAALTAVSVGLLQAASGTLNKLP